MTIGVTPKETPDFLAGGGEMSELIRAMDWSTTSLGPVELWPQSLRTTLSICLNSRFPMLLWWGSNLVMLYNDAYRPILGATRHPRALGAPGREIWPEIWDIFGPMLTTVIDRGEATWLDDLLLVLDRNGYPEERYLTFSNSPIRDEFGGVGGVFTAVHETPPFVGSVIDILERKRAELNTQFRVELDRKIAQMVDADEIGATALSLLGQYLGLASCTLSDIDPAANQSKAQYEWTAKSYSQLATYDLADFFPPAFWPVLEAGEIIAVDDVERDERTAALADNYARYSAAAIALAPYVTGRHLVATLYVDSATPRTWRADELQLLGEVVARVWPAIQRARAVTELGREQEALQTIIDRIPVMIMMYDPEARLTWLNSEFERVVGWSSRQAAEVSLMDEIYPDPEYRARISERVQSEQGDWMDIQMRTRDGRTIETSWTNVQLSDQTQVGIGIDITERKQMEEALRASEASFRGTFENAAVGIAHVGLDGTWLRMNDKLCEITGYSREELRHRTFQDITYPADLDTDLEYARQLLAGERQTYSMEKRYIRKDGSIVWANLTGSLLRSPAGEPKHYIAVVEDITLRKRAEATAQRQARLIELSHEPVIVWDLDGGIVEWNAGAERLYGFSPKEAIGHVSHDLLHTVHPLPLSKLKPLLKSGRSWAGELRHTAKDGREVIVASRQQLIEVDGRQLVLETNRDVTEQQRAEAALRDADRRKDEFLATLAHELRNPLAPVRNAVQILKLQGSLDPTSEAARDMIDRQVQHMVRLLDDLLDMSRITQDKLELRKEYVELAPILNQALETSRPHVESDGHEVSVSMPQEPIYLDADPVRLVQVFSNLMNNASKYTQPGGQIWLTAKHSGGEVIVSVKDTGAGIPPDKLDSVFDLFTQLNRPEEQSRSGLGIGLTLVKRLVEMHGGSVAAYSAGVGQGSEFVVRLPVLAELPQVGAVPPLAAEANGKPKRILVVDDNFDIAESLTELLELEGHEARMAHDGAEAVAAAQEFQPDVVLLDIDLPRMDGYEACRRIREQPWGKSISLVALTGWGQEEARRKSREVGFDYHLVKPVDFADLMALLAALPAQEGRRTKP